MTKTALIIGCGYDTGAAIARDEEALTALFDNIETNIGSIK